MMSLRLMVNINLYYTALALFLPLPVRAAQEWPMFRGPNACGVSETAKPPQEFGPEQNVVWKVEVPWSPGSVSIVNDRIFLNAFNDGALETRAYAAHGGKLLWTGTVIPKEVEEFHRTDGSPASGTPASDGEYVRGSQ